MELKEMVAHVFNLASSANNDFASGSPSEARKTLVSLRNYLDEQLPKEEEQTTETVPQGPG